MYGCHNLQLDDRDGDPANNTTPRWGGVVSPAASICPGPPPLLQVNPGMVNAVAIPQHVRQLQEDLRTLGFALVGAPSGTFDFSTHLAVREFQIYAGMGDVAQVRPNAPANAQQGAHIVAGLGQAPGTTNSVYVDSLQGVANGGAGHYAGHICGIVNQATRDCLDHWLQNNFRCPVVVEAWRTNQSGVRTTLMASNLWRHDSYANTAPRMFVRDFTGRYTLPATRAATDMHVIGDFVTFLAHSGPRSLPPNHVWAEGEFLPDALLGNATPVGAPLSTFKAIRAVAEVECMGYFDSVNCYDNAFVSVGPCHWTLGIVNGTTVAEGELCGYLSYLRHADAAAFREAFEDFGTSIDEDWNSTGAGDGSALFNASQKKYAGWVSFRNEAGNFARAPLTEAVGNYFKTWHWHYRFVMAGRCVTGYRERMWHMARVRVRDIRDVPWGAGVAAVATTPGQTRAATIGDVFTSEEATALLLRWHIRSPAHVVSAGQPGTRLRNALTAAQTATPQLSWNTDPSTWTDAHEAALIDGLVNAAPNNVQANFTYIRGWPTWLLAQPPQNPLRFTLPAPIASLLLETRDSFDFDDAALPPAPP